jgi:16S rRNA (guanine527-N7)-methyltransferase
MLGSKQTQILCEGAKQFSITLSEETISQFAIFIEEIQRWSKIVDLLSRTDAETLIHKHILDSLALLPWIPKGSRVLDLGSGAGFPGLPLAIANPESSITLIEARRKRANFLKDSIRKLRLQNVKAYEGRAEDLAREKNLQAAFNVITTRATWNIPLFLTLAGPFLRQHGVAIAMKGPRLAEELGEIHNKIKKTDFLHVDTKFYTLAGNEKRSLALFSKVSPKKCFT